MSNITGKTKMCIIIGDPVEHSLSPRMHNAAYEALGIDAEFVFTAAHVKSEDVQTVVDAVRAMDVRGLTVTIPHKVEVMQYLDEIDPIAQNIGAVNTVVNENGKLKGYNTDWLGVVTPLEKYTSLQGKKVAILGAGGAARAMIYGVMERGATVTIFNRTLEKAQELAAETGAQARSLDDVADIKNYDIIMNSTSLGMGKDEDKTPLAKEYITANHIVFDAVYVPYETRFLRESKEQGATIIHGIDMLLYQGTAQFELYTGKKAPEEVMRKSLLKHFGLKVL